jgi:RHS repeat-associated protein
MCVVGKRELPALTQPCFAAQNDSHASTWPARRYGDSGIRVFGKEVVDTGAGTQVTSNIETTYLNDPHNFTGYSQVAIETTIDVLAGPAPTKTVVYSLGHDVISQATITPQSPGAGQLLVLLYDGHGSTRALADSAGQIATASGIAQIFTYDAYGNALGFAPTQAATTLLYSGEQWDQRVQMQYLRARYYDSHAAMFSTLDPFVGSAFTPQTLNKYTYAHNNPIFNYDPSGESSLAVTLATAGIRSGFASLVIGAPFRVLEAAYDIAAGASFRDVSLDIIQGAATDFAIGAVLGGGGAGAVRVFGSNAFKIRAIGQSIASFTSSRVPWSVWKLAVSARGFAVEKAILNRAASFLGRTIPGFQVIDDYIIRGGRGIATSIKSLDLTAPSYQSATALVSRLNGYAQKLQNFTGATKAGFALGRGTENAIDDKVLLVAFEEGAATSVQANALVQWVRTAKAAFPDITVLVQFVP